MSCISVSPVSCLRSRWGLYASASDFEIALVLSEALMPTLYIVGAVISVALLVYLFFALLKPEMFQ